VLREELEQRYGPEYGALLTQFAELRKRMIAEGVKGPAIRARIAAQYRVRDLKVEGQA